MYMIVCSLYFIPCLLKFQFSYFPFGPLIIIQWPPIWYLNECLEYEGWNALIKVAPSSGPCFFRFTIKFLSPKNVFLQFKKLRILHSWGQVVIFYSDTPRHQTEWNLKEREDVFSESNLELPHLNKISILHKLKDIYLNFHGMGVSVILIMHKVDMIHKSPVNQLKWKYNTTFNSTIPQIR